MPAHSGGRSKSNGCIGSIVRFWRRSYAPDYIGLLILVAAFTLIQYFVEPFHRMFTLDNISIKYPHALIERVPPSWLFGYSIGVPAVVILLWSIFFRPGWHKAHVTFLALFISLIMTALITDVIKNSVGRPRPDLLSRCKPRDDTPQHDLVTFEVCQETNHHVLHDGWRSFPSGHSSFAFSGLGYLAIFLSGQLHVFRPGTDLARVLIALIPLIGAALIAISRCEDYRHDVYDVTVGSLLGFGIAFFSYRRYFPRLRSLNCDSPFPSRATTADLNGFAKIKIDLGRRGGDGTYVIEDPEYDPDAMALISPDSEHRREDLERGM